MQLIRHTFRERHPRHNEIPAADAFPIMRCIRLPSDLLRELFSFRPTKRSLYRTGSIYARATVLAETSCRGYWSGSRGSGDAFLKDRRERNTTIEQTFPSSKQFMRRSRRFRPPWGTAIPVPKQDLWRDVYVPYAD